MSLQYITDDEGQTTGVFIPIREWNELTSRYQGIDQDVHEVPEWQKEIVRERIKTPNQKTIFPGKKFVSGSNSNYGFCLPTPSESHLPRGRRWEGRDSEEQ